MPESPQSRDDSIDHCCRPQAQYLVAGLHLGGPLDHCARPARLERRVQTSGALLGTGPARAMPKIVRSTHAALVVSLSSSWPPLFPPGAGERGPRTRCGHILPDLRRRARLLHAVRFCHAVRWLHPREERQKRAPLESPGLRGGRSRLLVTWLRLRVRRCVGPGFVPCPRAAHRRFCRLPHLG